MILVGSCQWNHLSLGVNGTVTTPAPYVSFFLEKIVTSTGLIMMNVSTTAASVDFDIVISGQEPFSLVIPPKDLLDPPP